MTKIVKTSTVDALVNLLTDRIHERVYPPGSKLPSERLLQEELGVGRLALREALSRMNAMGIIETAHGKGTFVQDNLKSATLKNMLIPYFALSDSRRLKEFVDARAMIESEIAGLAARQRTQKDLETLEAILAQMTAGNDPGSRIAARDLEFHQALAGIVDNRFLKLMHEALISHIRRFLEEFVKAKQNSAQIMSAHQPILEAIRRRDEPEARRQVRQHLSFSMKDYEDFVRQGGPGF